MNGQRCLRGRALLILALAVAAAATPAPSYAARAQGGLSVAGGKAQTMRICGSARRTLVVSAERVVVTLRRAPRGVRTLQVSTCRGGAWKRLKAVRVARRRGSGAVRVKLPRLAAGAYRISAPGLGSVVVRLQRAAAPDAAGTYSLLDRSTIRAPMVAFCEGAD